VIERLRTDSSHARGEYGYYDEAESGVTRRKTFIRQRSRSRTRWDYRLDGRAIVVTDRRPSSSKPPGTKIDNVKKDRISEARSRLSVIRFHLSRLPQDGAKLYLGNPRSFLRGRATVSDSINTEMVAFKEVLEVCSKSLDRPEISSLAEIYQSLLLKTLLEVGRHMLVLQQKGESLKRYIGDGVDSFDNQPFSDQIKEAFGQDTEELWLVANVIERHLHKRKSEEAKGRVEVDSIIGTTEVNVFRR
jgi:hypothetical protein